MKYSQNLIRKYTHKREDEETHKLYRNIRNKRKYIELVHYKCGHYYIRQFIYYKGWNVLNIVGNIARNKVHKDTALSIIEDYIKLNSLCD